MRVFLALALTALVASLLLLELSQGRVSASRTIGVVLDMETSGLRIEEVTAGQPAAEAGLRGGDRIVSINGMSIATWDDYDRATQDFVRAESQEFVVDREGTPRRLEVVPGVGYRWMGFGSYALAAILHLALGLLVLLQEQRDVRSRLLAILLIAVGIELAMPSYLVGFPTLLIATEAAVWLLTGLQFSVELHLASVLPAPREWFSRRRWPRALFYGAGATLGLLLAASSWPGSERVPGLSWLWTSAGDRLLSVWFVVWALSLLLILAGAALRWPEARGRHQAWLVLLGVAPWAALTLATASWDLRGMEYPAWTEAAEPLVFLIYPLAIFFAIFRYQLFNLELVVRRSMLYTAMSTSLLLLFYGALGAGGAMFSAIYEGAVPTTWVVATATLVLGLVFGPLRRFFERQIGKLVVPERGEMRQRLRSVVRDLPARASLPTLADALAGSVVDVFAVESACLLVADRDSDLLVARASRNCDEPPEGLLLPKEDLFVEFLQQHGRSALVRSWPRGTPAALRLESMGGELAVPILLGDELTGLLVVGPKLDGGEIRLEERELLDLLGAHVAAVLENAYLFESASIDGLTGLLRREAVLADLDRELARAVRYSRPLTVGMVDIDRFKRVNDDHGHLAGDVLLRKVSRAIEESLRTTDIVGRYGGEEFLVLLPESDRETSLRVSERLRAAVEALEVELDDGERVGVTVSIGLADLSDLPEQVKATAEGLIEAADRSLYQAKRAGRNRVAMGVTRWAIS